MHKLTGLIKQDLEFQVHHIIQRNREVLEKRFDDKKFPDDYDLILRPFANSIEIRVGNIDFMQNISKIVDLEVPESEAIEINPEEEFYLDVASSHWIEDTKSDKPNIPLGQLKNFLQELQTLPALNMLFDNISREHLYDWAMNSEENHPFFGLLKQKYPTAFGFFDHTTTVNELKKTFLHAIERKYRNETIEYNMKCDGAQTIEEKIWSVAKWQIERSEDWFKEQNGYVPTYTPQGFQKFTVGEILPKDMSNKPGKVGGRTIKFATDGDVYQGFYL